MAVSPYEQLRAVRAATRVPRQAAGQLRDIARGVRSMVGVVRPTPTSLSASQRGRSARIRRYAWTSVAVADIKEVRGKVGGSFNDASCWPPITGGFRLVVVVP